MLTNQDKLNIYGLFAENFKKNSTIPLNQVEIYLKNHGLDPKEFGYKNMLALLRELDAFLTIKKVDAKDHPTIIFHDFVDNKQIKHDKVSSKSFDAKEKKKIFNLLISYLPPNQEFPMALVSKYLLDHKIDYKNYGFKQMKNLLSSLSEYLSLREVTQNGTKQLMIKIKPKKANVQHGNVAKNEKHILKQESDIAFFIPQKIIASLKEMCSLGLDDENLKKLIVKDYQTALKQKNIKSKDDNIIFSLSFKTRSGKKLIGAIKHADNNCAYKYFLNYVGDEEIKARDALKEFIQFPDYEKSIKELASLAKKEKWCYRHSKDEFIILKIYLQYTFATIWKQKLFIFNNDTGFGAFNTGLVTDDYQVIYGIVQRNNLKDSTVPYLFEGFATAGSQGLGKTLVESFNPLPHKAKYLTDIKDAFFDPNSLVYTDFEHIINDNLDRFPIDFLKTIFVPFKSEYQLLSKVIKENNEFKRQFLYKKISESLKKNDLLYNLLHSALYTTIERSKRMVEHDYRLALPSFFPTRNVMSMMLPLIFDTKKGVQAVLLVEHNNIGNYQGQTLLTLKQCYVNARLISPLDHSFLNPDEIED